MNIVLYTDFSKRRNSTKRPSGGISKSVVLKDGTSYMRPQFLCSSPQWPFGVNYASWGDSYYYVDDIVAEGNNLYRFVCSLDVLATFKTDIGNYSTMISRAAADQNYDIIDTIYPAKLRPITKQATIANPGLFTTNRANGCFMLGTVGSGGIKFFLLTPIELTTLFLTLFPKFSADTISNWIEKQITQAPVGGLNTIIQNIVLLKWLPISYSAVSDLITRVSEVTIGNFSTSISAGAIEGNTTKQVALSSIQFPDRDDAGARGRWLYSDPFASYSLYAPPFGMINIDASYMTSAGRNLTAQLLADVVSGNITLRLYYGLSYSGPKMVGVYNANISQDLKAGGSSASMGGVLGGVAGAISSAISQNVGGVLSSIGTAVNAGVPKASVVGGGVSGPSPDLSAPWAAYATYYDPIEENRAELGRPLAEVRQIGTLSGFVQTADASLSIPGHVAEMEEVNGLLNTGIFYE